MFGFTRKPKPASVLIDLREEFRNPIPSVLIEVINASGTVQSVRGETIQAISDRTSKLPKPLADAIAECIFDGPELLLSFPSEPGFRFRVTIIR